MGKYKISLNQLAEFSGASDASKRRIIKQQVNPDTFRVPRYQLTKARIKKSIELKGDLNPIHEAIRILESKNATTSWQINDKKVSLEALKRFIEIKIPSLLKKLDFQVIRPENKSIELRLLLKIAWLLLRTNLPHTFVQLSWNRLASCRRKIHLRLH